GISSKIGRLVTVNSQTKGSNTIIIRMDMAAGLPFIEIAKVVHDTSAEIVAVDTVSRGKSSITRDVTVSVSHAAETRLLDRLKQVAGLKVVNVSDRTFLMHLGGKLAIQSKFPIR